MCLQGDHDIDCNAQLRILAPGVLEVHCYCLCCWSCDPQLSIFQPPAELLSANFVEHRQPKREKKAFQTFRVRNNYVSACNKLQAAKIQLIIKMAARFGWKIMRSEQGWVGMFS